MQLSKVLSGLSKMHDSLKGLVQLMVVRPTHIAAMRTIHRIHLLVCSYICSLFYSNPQRCSSCSSHRRCFLEVARSYFCWDPATYAERYLLRTSTREFSLLCNHRVNTGYSAAFVPRHGE